MSKARRLAAVLIPSVLTAGCINVGPDYQEPGVAVAAQWLAAGDARVDVARPLDRAWWTVFQDETLDRLIDTAYRQNPTLVAAGTRVLQARAQLGIAIGDQYPQTQQAFGALDYQRRSARTPFNTIDDENLLTYWQDQIGLQAAWEIDFWGRFRRAIESADASLLAAVATYDDVLVSLTADVAQTYVQARTTEARLKIAEENVKVQRESLEIAEVRFRGGTTSERDVEQARTVLASTQATIPQLEATLRQTKNALSVLLGVPPSPLADVFAGESSIPTAPLQVAVGIPADLLRRRPDVRAAELRAAAQSAQIGVARADLFPAVSLAGNFGFLASDWGRFDLADIFMAKSRAFSIGPSVTWNFLNYGQITNNVRVQDAAFQALIAEYQGTVLQAQQEVEDGLIGFLKAQQRTELLRLSAEAARRSVDLAILQYREGITDFTTVLTAEQSLLQQQDALAVSLGEIPSSLIRTFRALGGGWEIREGGEFIPPDVREAMAKRTDWGRLLSPSSMTAADAARSDLVRLPDW